LASRKRVWGKGKKQELLPSLNDLGGPAAPARAREKRASALSTETDVAEAGKKNRGELFTGDKNSTLHSKRGKKDSGEGAPLAFRRKALRRKSAIASAKEKRAHVLFKAG